MQGAPVMLRAKGLPKFDGWAVIAPSRQYDQGKDDEQPNDPARHLAEGSLLGGLWLQELGEGQRGIAGDNQAFLFGAALGALPLGLGSFRHNRLHWFLIAGHEGAPAGIRTRMAVAAATRVQVAHVYQFRHGGLTYPHHGPSQAS